MEITDESLARFFGILLPHLNELQRRVAVGAMADVLGPGNNTEVETATQMSRNTIIKAVSEVRDGMSPPPVSGHLAGRQTSYGKTDRSSTSLG